MKLEVIKSYTLAILVGISLILSFGLWSYQPKEEKTIEEGSLLTEEQIDFGGREETKKSLVQPSDIIFHVNNTHYGFENPLNMERLYEDMGSWVFYNFRQIEAGELPDEEPQVEIVYPVALPLSIIPSLFPINNPETVILTENLSFQRVYITLEPNNTLTFTFVASDGKTQVRADVNNAQKHETLSSYMTTFEGLTEYTVLKEEEYPIYLPVDPIEISSFIFNVTTKKNPEILKNALFIDPSRVIENTSEDLDIWYQDGHRLMHVYENRLYMEYINPEDNQRNEHMTSLELLDQSLAKINGYKGWIQDYHLESISTSSVFNNHIRYQMYFLGYPVFNHNDISMIEQMWSDELRLHRQSLFTINNPVQVPNNFELNSGKEIVSYLKNNSSNDLNKIEAVKVGYRLSYKEITDQKITLSLTPAWYVKVKGKWNPILTDEELLRKGVS